MTDQDPASDRLSLPPLLAAVADAAGLPGALSLMTEFGGQEIKVPKIPRPGQVLWRRCGPAVAHALAALRGGENVPIPNGAALRSKKQAILKAQGSGNAVARDTRSSARYVRMIRNHSADPLPLFDHALGPDSEQD